MLTNFSPSIYYPSAEILTLSRYSGKIAKLIAKLMAKLMEWR
jgi:hypothetical protein